MISPCVRLPIYTLLPPKYSIAMIARLSTAYVRGLSREDTALTFIEVCDKDCAALSNTVFSLSSAPNALTTLAPD